VALKSWPSSTDDNGLTRQDDSRTLEFADAGDALDLSSVIATRGSKAKPFFDFPCREFFQAPRTSSSADVKELDPDDLLRELSLSPDFAQSAADNESLNDDNSLSIELSDLSE
ncbi:hypothetical protein EV179_006440, partial [Coemansia sp. RSA 487]